MSLPLFALKEDLDMIIQDVYELKHAFNSIDEIAGRFKDMHDEQTCQAEQMRRIEGRLDIIEHRLDKNDLRMDRIEKDIGILKTDVAGLKSDVATLKSDVVQIKLELSQIQKTLLKLCNAVNLLVKPGKKSTRRKTSKSRK